MRKEQSEERSFKTKRVNLGKAGLIVWAVLLSGCELLPASIQGPENKVQVCTASTDTDRIDECDLSPWFEYWVSNSKQSWPQRRVKLQQLGQSDADLLRSILLSQAAQTPYQYRLRALLRSQKLLERYPQMAGFLQGILILPEQERLELESAVSSLSRINAQQSQELEQLKLKISEQSQKMKRLLEIESHMLNKSAERTPAEFKAKGER